MLELYFTKIGNSIYNTNIIEDASDVKNVKNVKIIKDTDQLIITDSSEKKLIILNNIIINSDYTGIAIFDNATDKVSEFKPQKYTVFAPFGDEELEYIKAVKSKCVSNWISIFCFNDVIYPF